MQCNYSFNFPLQVTCTPEHIALTGISVVIHAGPGCECRRDATGNLLWWFGGTPVGGVPEPAAFLESLAKDGTPRNEPPWAAVAWNSRDQTVAICTDRLGLQHLFVRKLGTALHVSSSAPLLAGLTKPSIDPVGLYQLLKCGNPQSGRTVFADVKCIEAATVLTIRETVQSREYWSPPEYEGTDSECAMMSFCNAVQAAVVRQYRSGDLVEVTAGKDSMLVFAALKAAGVDFKAWTFGDPEDIDVQGARNRCSRYSVPHEVLPMSWIDTLDPEDAFDLCRRWVASSSGMSDALTYGILPRILRDVRANASMSGGAGEAFRGFYYRSAGWGMPMPRWARRFLLQKKIQAQEPFGCGVLRSEVIHQAHAVFQQDLITQIDGSPDFWHNLDRLYIMSRMHSFGGGNISATNSMMPVRIPFASPEVLDCLRHFPVDQRGARRSIVEAASELLLKGVGTKGSEVVDNLTRPKFGAGAIRKILRRIQGQSYSGRWAQFATAALSASSSRDLLDLSRIAAWGVFDESRLISLLKSTSMDRNGESLSVSLGKILTVAIAMDEAETQFAQTPCGSGAATTEGSMRTQKFSVACT